MRQGWFGVTGSRSLRASRFGVTGRKATLLVLLVVAGAGSAAPLLGQPAGTLKERLSDKASDQQRTDDCKVPPEKRGSSTRPADCNHVR